MKTKISVLIIEDSDDDVKLVLRELNKGDYEVNHRLVQDSNGLKDALKNEWDVIISDYSLPGFNGYEALRMCNEKGKDIPFIIVSGTVGEEIAVEMLKSGARDYIMKSNLALLLSSVEREINDAVIRKAKKEAEDALKESQTRLSSIYDTVGDVIFYLEVVKHGCYRFISVNNSFLSVTGLNYEQVVGKYVNEVIPEPSLSIVLSNYETAIKDKKIIRWEETSEYPSGKLIGDVCVTPVFDNNGKCTHLVGAIHDITDRKLAEEETKRKMDELQRFQILTVGRELTMIELKKEVNALLKKSGQEEKYTIVK